MARRFASKTAFFMLCSMKCLERTVSQAFVHAFTILGQSAITVLASTLTLQLQDERISMVLRVMHPQMSLDVLEKIQSTDMAAWQAMQARRQGLYPGSTFYIYKHFKLLELAVDKA